jgi:hypothetical protein
METSQRYYHQTRHRYTYTHTHTCSSPPAHALTFDRARSKKGQEGVASESVCVIAQFFSCAPGGRC